MSRTILIVDDLDLSRRILNKILSSEYNTIQADNGLSAIEILNSRHKDISAVLLDVEMPCLNGHETLVRIRESSLYSQIPVIMVTGTEDEESRKRFLAIGANDFLTKPYTPELILHCVKNNIMLKEVSDTVLALQRDKLTGLLVRDAFFEKVQEMVFSQKPGYYIMNCFDVEKFKVINDQYGTEKGDEVLRYIANTFREGFGDNGGICCRISSDNFAVLYPSVFKDTKEIEDIRSKASLIEGLASPVFFCIGRYLVEDLDLSPSSMYDRARIAADSVKGRFDVRIATFDKSMLDHLLYEQEVVTEMQGALDNNQFEVWYQPQFNHSTKAIIGSEALVRWRHPKKGLIPPYLFIPVFERNGFIYQLDKFVWEEVCKNLRRWIDDGRKPLAVSVNISRYDLLNDDVVDVICHLVQKYNLPVEILRLEITESAFSQNSEKIIEQASEFIKKGFTLEIDDFGSGYSSLNSLKDVPAQIIKLDMKFMDKNNSQRGGNIVSSIVRMSKWLGMSIIAEGVETVEQADFLNSVGCSYIQGYLYAKPMGLKDYEALCLAQSKEEHLMVLETVQNLDNNRFWDPSSVDALVFNSYVSGACIMEYFNKNLEIIRVTENYAKVLGNSHLSVEESLKINWLMHLDPEDKIKVEQNLIKSIESNQEIVGEYCFVDLPGCAKKTYLRSVFKPIARSGERYLIYCTNENITIQKNAQLMERQLSDQMKCIMDSVDIGITATLLNGGQVEFLFANNQFFTIMGYSREEYFEQIKDIFSLICPEDRDIVEESTIKQWKSDSPSSVIEFDIYSKEERKTLRVIQSVASFAGYEGPVLVSIFRDITLERTQQRLLLDNLPCGAVLLEYQNGKISLVHINKTYWQLMGKKPARLANGFDAIHPDDRKNLHNEIVYAIAQKTPRKFSFRLLNGHNDYCQVEMVAKIEEKDNGQFFIYGTITPMINQFMSIQQSLPIALSSMLSSTTDIAYVKDKDLCFICCSKSMANLCKLEKPDEMIGKKVEDFFPIENSKEITLCDNQILQTGKPIVDKEELIKLYSGEEIKLMSSRYPLLDATGNVTGLYGVKRRVY